MRSLSLTISLLLPSLAPLAYSTPSTCNGFEELCTRQYSNISMIGSHDSAFVGSLPQQNQNLQITQQLDMGIRFLQGQTHVSPFTGALELCHTSCWLEDAGTVQSFLETVKAWLDNNPNEVVTLLLTNGDSVNVTTFGDAYSASGITDYVYIPPQNPLPINEWPTLEELIETGKRLVAFLDYGADTSLVPYVLDEFSYFFETPYDVTNASFPLADCSLNRPAGASPDGRMMIINHFLDDDILGIDIPARSVANTTNSWSGPPPSLGAQVEECYSVYNRLPNGVLVDFVDQGDVIVAQNVMNGVS